MALARQGYKVGLLDADIFGPSAPTMFNIEDTEVYTKNIGGRDLILPVERYGVKILYIGFFVRKKDDDIWRGGMASNDMNLLNIAAAWYSICHREPAIYTSLWYRHSLSPEQL